MYWFRHLQLRWKLLIMVMPLVFIPLILVAVFISNISISLAYEGITRASKDDLEHMSNFSLDLIEGHYRQYEVYRQEKEVAVQQKLRDIVDLSYNLVETHHEQFLAKKLPLESVKRAARSGLKFASVGEGGYISVMDSSGKLLVHPVLEGKDIYSSRDENGRMFIQEMCDAAVTSPAGKVLYIKYSWKNALLGDERPREKMVAYRYFPQWGWIISAGSYLDEIFDEKPFENRAFMALKKQLIEKKVGETGFIYAANCEGTLVLHPLHENMSIYTWMDKPRRQVLGDLCEGRSKSSWSRSVQQRGPGEKPRASIARMEYFAPWDWVVVVEAYEDELFGPAAETRRDILVSVVFLSFLVCGASGMLTFYAAKRFTFPIFMMTREIEQAKGRRSMKKISVPAAEELRKLAVAFNNMSELLKREKELEANLARMEKMASIGVLSSGVAHEINNPMGVILGYACHLENKLEETDPNYHFVQEIKQESKRCVKIVQNLLDYAKAPRLTMATVEINSLVGQIIDFAAGHADMDNITITKEFAKTPLSIEADGDQLRQVVMNLLLNAGAATEDGGEIRVTTGKVGDRIEISVADAGQGISAENLEEVYEPFFTTKVKGTGLGLAISKQIVEAHLGSMNISSSPQQGTTVVVSLPLNI